MPPMPSRIGVGVGVGAGLLDLGESFGAVLGESVGRLVVEARGQIALWELHQRIRDAAELVTFLEYVAPFEIHAGDRETLVSVGTRLRGAEGEIRAMVVEHFGTQAFAGRSGTAQPVEPATKVDMAAVNHAIQAGLKLEEKAVRGARAKAAWKTRKKRAAARASAAAKSSTAGASKDELQQKLDDVLTELRGIQKPYAKWYTPVVAVAKRKRNNVLQQQAYRLRKRLSAL